MNEEDAIMTLDNLSGLTFTAGGEAPSAPKSKTESLKILNAIERQFQHTNSFQLEYALANAWRPYARGAERKRYLKRVVDHLARSYELAKNEDYHSSGPHDRFGSIHPSLRIAGELGAVLVREAPIRDLDRAIPYLKELYENTKTYEPALCSYVEAFYKLGDYNRAGELVVELKDRAMQDPEWSDSIPSGMSKLAAKAYRAEGKKLKKDGRLSEAATAFRKVADSSFATEVDLRLLDECLQGN